MSAHGCQGRVSWMVPKFELTEMADLLTNLFYPSGGRSAGLHDGARWPVPCEFHAAGLQALYRRRDWYRPAPEALQEPRGHRLLQGASKFSIVVLNCKL